MINQISLVSLLNRAFEAPEEVLGTGERNAEIKIGFLALWALGWHPIDDIALGAQIPRNSFEPVAGAANAVDFLVRTGSSTICIVGEVKHWHTKEPAWQKGLTQLRRYRNAIPAPLAFLTTGKRWLIINDAGCENLIEEPDGANLIEKLAPILGKANVLEGLNDRSIWDYGINPSRSSRKATQRSPIAGRVLLG